MPYEPIAKARFALEPTANGDAIRIKARRPIFQAGFMCIWLTGWTFAGIMAAVALVTHFQVFLVIWLCAWAAGWVAVAATLAWMFTGSETLDVVGADLEIAYHALGWSRRRLYQGAEIRRLSAAGQPGWPYRSSLQLAPFLMTGRSGSIRFDYGARTIYAAPGLDEAEGRMIVERLLKRLPAAAG